MLPTWVRPSSVAFVARISVLGTATQVTQISMCDGRVNELRRGRGHLLLPSCADGQTPHCAPPVKSQTFNKTHNYLKRRRIRALIVVKPRRGPLPAVVGVEIGRDSRRAVISDRGGVKSLNRYPLLGWQKS
jgi:hypothetical protein